MRRLLLVPLLAMLAPSQTKIDLTNQAKQPYIMVGRAVCQGNGTYPDGTKWDCNGLELYQFTLADGTVKGPFVAVPATPSMIASPLWVKKSIQ